MKRTTTFKVGLMRQGVISYKSHEKLVSTSLVERRIGYCELCKNLSPAYAKQCLWEAYCDHLSWQTEPTLLFLHDRGLLKSVVKKDEHYQLYLITKASLTSVGGAILNHVQLLYPPTKQDILEALQNSNYNL